MTVWPLVRMDDKPRPPPKTVRGPPTSLGCSSKVIPVPNGVDLRLSRGQSLDVGIPPSRTSSHSSGRRRLTRHASKERSTAPEETRRSSRVSVISGQRGTSPNLTSEEINKSQQSVHLSPIHDGSPFVSEPKVSQKRWKDIDGEEASLSCSASHQGSSFGGRKHEEAEVFRTAPRTPQTPSKPVSVRTSPMEICISHARSPSSVSARSRQVEAAKIQGCQRRCKNMYGEESSFSCTEPLPPAPTLSELTRSVFIKGRDPEHILPLLSNRIIEDRGQAFLGEPTEPDLQTPHPTATVPDEDTDQSNPLLGLTASLTSDVPLPFTSGVDICLSRGEPDRKHSTLVVSETDMKEAGGDTPLDALSDSYTAVRWAESEHRDKVQRHVSGDMVAVDNREDTANAMAEGASDKDVAVFIAMQTPVSEPGVHVFDVATGRSDCNDSDFMTGDEGGEEEDDGDEDGKSKKKEARSDKAGESDYATADEEEANIPPQDKKKPIAPEPSENEIDKTKSSGALNETRLGEESNPLDQPFKNECFTLRQESSKIERQQIREGPRVTLQESEPRAMMSRLEEETNPLAKPFKNECFTLRQESSKIERTQIRVGPRVALQESEPVATAVEMCGISYTEGIDESVSVDDARTPVKYDTQVSSLSRVDLDVTDSSQFMSFEEEQELPVGDTLHPTDRNYMVNECLRDDTISGVPTYQHTPPLSRTREYPPGDDVVNISVPSEGVLLPPGFLESHPGDVLQSRPSNRLGSRPECLPVPEEVELSLPPPDAHPEYTLPLSQSRRSESQLNHGTQKPQRELSPPKLELRFASCEDVPSVPFGETESPMTDLMRRHRSQMFLQIVDTESPLPQTTEQTQPINTVGPLESTQPLQPKNLVQNKATFDTTAGTEFPVELPQDLWSIRPQTSLLRQDDQIVPSLYHPQYAPIPENNYDSMLLQDEPPWAIRTSPYDQPQSRPMQTTNQLDGEKYEDGTLKIPRSSDQYGLTERRCSSRSRRLYDVIPETDLESVFHPGRLPRVPVFCTCEEPVQALPTVCLQSFPPARTAFHLCPDAAAPPTALSKRCSNCGQDCNSESLCKALGVDSMPRDRRKALLARAIATCQEELGPLNETLSLLHQKIRALDLPEFSSLSKRQSGAIFPRHHSSDALLPRPPRIRSSTSVGEVGKPHICMCVSQARNSSGAREMGPIGSACPHCGLRLVPEPALSPLARMYILLAQPKVPSPPTDDTTPQL